MSKKKVNLGVRDVPNPLSWLSFSLQHLFAMFGSTILVPKLVGMSPAVALVTSGIGTLAYLLVTKGQIPAYLGSSFAFISPIILVKATGGRGCHGRRFPGGNCVRPDRTAHQAAWNGVADEAIAPGGRRVGHHRHRPRTGKHSRQYGNVCRSECKGTRLQLETFQCSRRHFGHHHYLRHLFTGIFKPDSGIDRHYRRLSVCADTGHRQFPAGH